MPGNVGSGMPKGEGERRGSPGRRCTMKEFKEEKEFKTLAKRYKQP